ncbi:MAG: TlpA disulfide reductase family protein [Clostridia bacterium]|nr:TlpA disulfide reductase family protein [Clostridia bacterium]
MLVGFEKSQADALKAEIFGDAQLTKVGESSTHVYYKIVAEEPDEALSPENQAEMVKAIALTKQVFDAAQVVEITEESYTGTSIGAFSTRDLQGSEVTDDIFAQADLTVLNVWATTCPPCIREMPELEAWSHDLPENVQVIGLVIDVSDTSGKVYDTAMTIIGKTGVTYRNLMMDRSLTGFVSGIIGTPTTFFVDKDGRQVCEPVVGAYMDMYRQNVTDWLSGR